MTRGLSMVNPGMVDGLEPVAMIACSKKSRSTASRSVLRDLQRARVAERRASLDVVDLAHAADLTDAAGQLRDDLVL